MNRRTFSASLLAAAASAQAQDAVRARRSAIAAAVRALERERETSGHADYKAWNDSLSSMRNQLRALMTHAATEDIRTSPSQPEAKIPLFTVNRTPPLYCMTNPGEYVAPKGLDPLAWSDTVQGPEAILATSRWLKTKGVDLLFVPVPTIVDVYIDAIVPGGVPPNLIAAPHLRKALLRLLQRDVEVVDILPALLKNRDTADYPLYFPADGHWSHTGIDVAVQALAGRLSRYPSIQAARKSPPVFKPIRTKDRVTGSLYPFLKPQERSAIEPILDREYEAVTRADGTPYGSYATGPVVLIGDSFSPGVGPPLARALNAPVAMFPIPGGSVESIKALLRNPEALAGASAVVWVVNYAIVFRYKWDGVPEIVTRAVPAASRK